MLVSGERDAAEFELSSIGDVSGSVRFSTNEKILADCGESDFSEGVDTEMGLTDQMPTENELGDNNNDDDEDDDDEQCDDDVGGDERDQCEEDDDVGGDERSGVCE